MSRRCQLALEIANAIHKAEAEGTEFPQLQTDSFRDLVRPGPVEAQQVGDPEGLHRICLGLADPSLAVGVDLQRVDDRHVITLGGELIVEAEPILLRRLQGDSDRLVMTLQPR